MTSRDYIYERIRQLEKINRERPCSKCIWHRHKNGYFKCDAAVGACNFNHDNFTPKSGIKVDINSEQTE